MDRRVEGTFQSKNEAKVEIERLINIEGYRPDELLLVTDENGNHETDYSDIENVKIDLVNADDEGSFWEKIKEALSFGSYHSEEAENTLEKHGVTHELSDHYLEALQEGEIILLANTDAPSHPELSDINEEIVNEKENVTMVDKKKDAPLDEVNTEEEDAIKDSKSNGQNQEPSDVSTKETDDENVKEGMDPGQANDTRSDESENDHSETEEDEDTANEDDATDPSSSPDLTGEEETVESESTDFEEPTIAKGQVKPEAKSPLNAKPKNEKEPSDNTDDPEADAEYSDDSEEAGMKSEDEN